MEQQVNHQPNVQEMLIFMINTYTDAVYGAGGEYHKIKQDILSATGMEESFFESIKQDLDFVHFTDTDAEE